MFISSDVFDGLVGHRLGNHPQIVGDQTPANPAFHPIVAVITAASQAVAPFEPADTPFDPSSPVSATLEPALPFVYQPRHRLGAWFGQHDLLDPLFLRISFAPRRICAAIATQHVWRLLEALQMMIDT